jgi:hypothetical protein
MFRQAQTQKKLTGKDLSADEAMPRDKTFTVAEVADRVGVSPATPYRYLPGWRGAAV